MYSNNFESPLSVYMYTILTQSALVSSYVVSSRLALSIKYNKCIHLSSPLILPSLSLPLSPTLTPVPPPTHSHLPPPHHLFPFLHLSLLPFIHLSLLHPSSTLFHLSLSLLHTPPAVLHPSSSHTTTYNFNLRPRNFEKKKKTTDVPFLFAAVKVPRRYKIYLSKLVLLAFLECVRFCVCVCVHMCVLRVGGGSIPSIYKLYT